VTSCLNFFIMCLSSDLCHVFGVKARMRDKPSLSLVKILGTLWKSQKMTTGEHILQIQVSGGIIICLRGTLRLLISSISLPRRLYGLRGGTYLVGFTRRLILLVKD
jgi:hypothetical protein